MKLARCSEVIRYIVAFFSLAVCVSNAAHTKHASSLVAADGYSADSVLTLAKEYSGSPLVIQYQRVFRYDTSDVDGSIDSIESLSGYVFNGAGMKVIPYHITSHKVIHVANCNLDWLLVYSRSYDLANVVDDNGAYHYLIDIKSGRLLDSGLIEVVGYGAYLGYGAYYTVRRMGKYGSNVIDPCKGPLFSWADPFVNSIASLWYHENTLRLFVRDSEKSWRIVDRSKRTIPSCFISLVTWSTEWNDVSAFGPTFYDKDGKQFLLNPIDGKVYPEWVASFRYARWWFCEGYSAGCMRKMRLENISNTHPCRSLSQLRVRLTISDKTTNEVKYSREHWLNVNLGLGDVGSTAVFDLGEDVWINGEVGWSIKILDYK